MDDNVWSEILTRLRATIEPDEFRRWFSASAQASDSGDHLTIWVPNYVEARHINLHYIDRIYRELASMGRFNVLVRFVPTGYEDEEDEDEE